MVRLLISEKNIQLIFFLFQKRKIKNKRRFIYLLLLINTFLKIFRGILDKMSKKEEKRILEGLITESLPNGMFRVLLDKVDKVDKENRVILGYISGKIRRGSIRILPGDRVKIELSQYDDARGRIIFRLPPNKPSDN